MADDEYWMYIQGEVTPKGTVTVGSTYILPEGGALKAAKKKIKRLRKALKKAKQENEFLRMVIERACIKEDV